MKMSDARELKEWWEHQKSLERMHRSMLLWDKKLANLNVEMLYYILMRATNIIESREKKDV